MRWGFRRGSVKSVVEIVPISDAYATFNEKGKVVWDPMEMEGSLQDVPIWEKRVDY